jgi:hypothetical protein
MVTSVPLTRSTFEIVVPLTGCPASLKPITGLTLNRNSPGRRHDCGATDRAAVGPETRMPEGAADLLRQKPGSLPDLIAAVEQLIISAQRLDHRLNSWEGEHRSRAGPLRSVMSTCGKPSHCFAALAEELALLGRSNTEFGEHLVELVEPLQRARSVSGGDIDANRELPTVLVGRVTCHDARCGESRTVGSTAREPKLTGATGDPHESGGHRSPFGDRPIGVWSISKWFAPPQVDNLVGKVEHGRDVPGPISVIEVVTPSCERDDVHVEVITNSQLKPGTVCAKQIRQRAVWSVRLQDLLHVVEGDTQVVGGIRGVAPQFVGYCFTSDLTMDSEEHQKFSHSAPPEIRMVDFSVVALEDEGAEHSQPHPIVGRNRNPVDELSGGRGDGQASSGDVTQVSERNSRERVERAGGGWIARRVGGGDELRQEPDGQVSTELLQGGPDERPGFGEIAGTCRRDYAAE